MRQRAVATDSTDEDDAVARVVIADDRPFFVYRARWFVLSQTDGEPYQQVDVPFWNEDLALATLGIRRVPFDATDGNTQGYSSAQSIAISPVAALPHKTLMHEVAHIILGHTKPECNVRRNVQELAAESVALLVLDALGLAGAEYCRGYVQSWASSEDLTDDVASGIMTAADLILRAGQEPSPACKRAA